MKCILQICDQVQWHNSSLNQGRIQAQNYTCLLGTCPVSPLYARLHSGTTTYSMNVLGPTKKQNATWILLVIAVCGCFKSNPERESDNPRLAGLLTCIIALNLCVHLCKPKTKLDLLPPGDTWFPLPNGEAKLYPLLSDTYHNQLPDKLQRCRYGKSICPSKLSA